MMKGLVYPAFSQKTFTSNNVLCHFFLSFIGFLWMLIGGILAFVLGFAYFAIVFVLAYALMSILLLPGWVNFWYWVVVYRCKRDKPKFVSFPEELSV